ncbi:MAG: (2Fe-2S)-binding protein [Candidatus Hadarchaeaceae archaeon]
MGKKIVCICQDITEEEVVDAIKQGYDDIESLKRYTGALTGPCQGKACLRHVITILARELGKSPKEVGVPTQRPPIKPIALGILAGESSE